MTKQHYVPIKDSEVILLVEGEEIRLEGLEDAEISYFARDTLNPIAPRFFLVSRKKFSEDYRLHIGKPGTLSEAKITNMERLRDGGSTFFDYSLSQGRGTLSFPRPDKGPSKNEYEGRISILDRLD